MSLLDTILGAQGGAVVQQLGSQFGLGPEQTTAALSALVPALAAGVHRNVQSEDGLASLTSALSGGSHSRYLDDPTTLGAGSTLDEGNAILGQMFGDKEVSRQVASHAAGTTGISPDLLKQMLPMVATLVMGALANRSQNASAMSAGAGGGGASAGGFDLASILSSTLSQSPAQPSGGAGDLVGMLTKLLR